MRSGGSPVISTVVRAVSTTDNFAVLGRESQVTESRFSYHDGYYEGIEQEFRGFGAADATTIGDWNNPTVHSRTWFLQGRRPSDIAGDRLAHNPYEALKGREYLTEVFDDEGAYLSTSFATLTNRMLATGIDGRPIHFAYVYDTNELRYDTTPFVPGGSTLELEWILDESVDPGTGEPGASTVARTRTVTVRADSDHVSRIRTRWYRVANVGLTQRRLDSGQISLNGIGAFDDRIDHLSSPVLLNDGGQWIWRTSQTYVADNVTHPLGSTPLQRTFHYFTPEGDESRTILSHGTFEAQAFGGEASFPGEGGAQSYTQTAANQNLSFAYDAWGQPLTQCVGDNISGNPTLFRSGCLRYSRTAYDTAFEQVVTTETIFTSRSSSSSGDSLESSGEWDRGLGAITRVTDPNGLHSTVSYDGLGRLTSVTPPNVAGCTGENVATHLHYELTPNPSAQPISRVRSITELGCDGVGTGDTLESIAYVDGLGRTRAALATNDGSSWVRSGLTTLDRKGTVRRTYQTDLYAGSTTSWAAVVALPSTPYAVVRYDAFGRTRGVIAEDHSVTWTSYHSLSTDVCDPLDNDPSSPFFHTCATTVVDGFGRTIDQILRNVDPDSGATETYHLWSYYRADGSVMGLVRANGGTRPSWYTGTLPAESVVRTFTYDTHGRRVASHDPDTDSPGGVPGSDTWRYLYNKANDLIAVRDPRGCGQNFFYDHAGRLRGEQYVACTEAQRANAEGPSITLNGAAVDNLIADVLVTGNRALDVVYEYDDYAGATWASGVLPAGAGDVAQGRATSVTDRGQRAAIAYDDRGNAVWTARQMAVISAPIGLDAFIDSVDGLPVQDEQPATNGTVTYDDDHTYVRTATFDHAGRPREIELPTDPDFSGTAPVIQGELLYNTRGLPSQALARVGTTEQVIVQSIEYLRDGLVSSITYGDDDDGSGAGSRTPTQSQTTYDARRRPTRMWTTRQVTGLSDGPGEHSPLDDVTVVVDQQLGWDAANNLIAITDHRDPSQWGAGNLPQSVEVRHDALYRVIAADYSYT
ncbi:MAG: RHS repeat protein, partial [Myxococcales bacterium]|nr:RHS repeat protein [Myxococcales bacterium]